MVANPKKFQLLFPRHPVGNVSITVGDFIISNTNIVTLLGVDIDSKLSFYPHIRKICKRVSQKSKALMRIRNYLDHSKVDSLFSAFSSSEFNYCPSGVDVL
jgi:hypothetical protein